MSAFLYTFCIYNALYLHYTFNGKFQNKMKSVNMSGVNSLWHPFIPDRFYDFKISV